MAIEATPQVRVTRYAVSMLPEAHPEARHFTIYVEYRGRAEWVVSHLGGYLRASDCIWVVDDTEVRYDEETALALARLMSPSLEINGRTVLQALRAAASEGS